MNEFTVEKLNRQQRWEPLGTFEAESPEKAIISAAETGGEYRAFPNAAIVCKTVRVKRARPVVEFVDEGGEDGEDGT